MTGILCLFTEDNEGGKSEIQKRLLILISPQSILVLMDAKSALLKRNSRY